MSLYVVKGAQMQCSLGSKKPQISTLQNRKIKIDKKPIMLETDTVVIENIPCFGVCKQKMPCSPLTNDLWDFPDEHYKSDGYSVLVATQSILRCAYGGIITFIDSGQAEDCLENSQFLQEVYGPKVQSTLLYAMQNNIDIRKPYPSLLDSDFIQLCKDYQTYGEDSNIYQQLISSAIDRSLLTFNPIQNKQIDLLYVSRDIKQQVIISKNHDILLRESMEE